MISEIEYHAPESVVEALRLLQQYGPDAKLIAGGQSLVPLMNLGLARPAVLVSLHRIRALRSIRQDGAVLRIGAGCTHAEIGEADLSGALCPLLPAAARLIGHAQIRNRGTIGGSLAHADPAAEWPLAVSCLEGRIKLQGPEGERSVPAQAFFTGAYATAARPDELITEVEVPIPPHGHGWSIQEFARRPGDFALAAAAALVVTDASGALVSLRLTLGSVATAPLDLSSDVSARIKGRPSPESLRLAVSGACAGLAPPPQGQADPEYRRELATELAGRALVEAWARSESATAPTPAAGSGI